MAEGLSVEEDVKKTLLEEQVEVSEEQLLKLALEGKELVSFGPQQICNNKLNII